MLTLVDLLDYPKYAKKARPLFLRAFPPEERPPFSYMERAAKEDKGVVLEVAIEENELVGLAFLVVAPKFAYLYFLAIEEDKRNHGYGHKILSLIKEKYPDKPIMLLAESLSVPCSNKEEREKRMAFYHSAGYSPLGYGVNEYGVAYDALSCGGFVDYPSYHEAMEKLWGKDNAAKWIYKF